MARALSPGYARLGAAALAAGLVALAACDGGGGGGPAERAPAGEAGGGATGRLLLEVRPEAALIELDGRFLGISQPGAPFPVVAPQGLHELVAQRTGYHDHVSRLRFRAGEVRHAELHLRPHAHPLPQPGLPRTLRLGRSVRGTLARGDARAEALLGRFDLGSHRPVEGAWADLVRLEDLPEDRELRLTVAASASQVAARVLRTSGVVVAEATEAEWAHRLDLTPGARELLVMVENREMDKNARLGLCRYTLTLELLP